MNRKQQGDLGVAAAIFHYTKSGHVVSIPNTENSKYDLVVEIDGVLKRVQCKSTRFKTEYGVYQVQLSTQGGNRSGIGKHKQINNDQCDMVFVYCLNGDQYELPIDVVRGKNSLKLGTKQDKYRIYQQ